MSNENFDLRWADRSERPWGTAICRITRNHLKALISTNRKIYVIGII